jgi:ribA/ribD-fused uncharacterized protein
MITEFKGDYKWLSNFQPVDIILNNIKYPTVEHAYMSMKSNDIKWKELCANRLISPSVIKKESREIKLVENWLDIKIQVMKKCLIQKYFQEPYKTLLLNTNDEYIQEGNMWGDTYWGVCLKTKKGDNNLGKIIMSVRNKLNNLCII